jgi:hypothetical protein
MTCCTHHTGRLTTLHTPTGEKKFCPACLDLRIDMPRIAEALSDIPDYTPNLEREVVIGHE